MKKSILITLLAAFSFGAAAQSSGLASGVSQGYNPGGFNGPQPQLTSVAQAKMLRDDSWVILEGNIVRQVGHELYEFRDNSGTIYVDIDDKRWLGQTASSTTKVRLEGEVDHDWNGIEIDVKRLQVLGTH